MRLLNDYNLNPKAYSDKEADAIAKAAKAFGLRFERSGKAGKKFLFDLADTAVLGAIPNEWRPQARGDRYFGETGLDRIAGGAGSLLGLAGTGGLALANRAALSGLARAGAKRAVNAGSYGIGAMREGGSRVAQAARGAYGRMPDAGALGTRVADQMSRGRQAVNKFSSLDRGKLTVPFGNVGTRVSGTYNRFMEPIRNRNLLDMMDEVRAGIPRGGFGGVARGQTRPLVQITDDVFRTDQLR